MPTKRVSRRKKDKELEAFEVVDVKEEQEEEKEEKKSSVPAKFVNSVLDIPLSKLKFDLGDRSAKELDAVSALAASIEHNGQITPIVISAPDSKDKKSTIIAGKKRFAAIKKLGAKTIRAVFLPDSVSGEDNSIEMLSDNMFHSPPNPVNQAKVMQSLLDNGVYKNQKDLAAALGVSQPLVSKQLKLLDLPEEVQKEVSKGEIAASTASASVKGGKKSRKAPKSTDEVSESAAANKKVKLSKEYLIPEGEEEPVSDMSVRIGKKEVNFTFSLSVTKMRKNGIAKTVKEIVGLIGEKELVKSINRTIRQEL
jgi:ParB/RepB/Spo0J family partition protein